MFNPTLSTFKRVIRNNHYRVAWPLGKPHLQALTQDNGNVKGSPQPRSENLQPTKVDNHEVDLDIGTPQEEDNKRTNEIMWAIINTKKTVSKSYSD